MASVFLETLTFYNCHDQLPRELTNMITAEQDALLRLWAELNDD